MKSNEFINEDSHVTIRSVSDVKQQVPEIYEYFKKTGDWMSFDHYGKVGSYHTGGQLIVTIDIQPCAGMGNHIANLDSAGLPYNKNEYGIEGTIPDTEIIWQLRYGGQRGNQIAEWRFELPRKNNVDEHAKQSTVTEGLDEKSTKATLYTAFHGEKLSLQSITMQPEGDDGWIKITAKGEKPFMLGTSEVLKFFISLLYDTNSGEVEGEVYSQQHHLDKKYSQYNSYENDEYSLEEYAAAVNQFVTAFTKAEKAGRDEGERQYWASGGRGMMPGSVTKDYGK